MIDLSKVMVDLTQLPSLNHRTFVAGLSSQSGRSSRSLKEERYEVFNHKVDLPYTCDALRD